MASITNIQLSTPLSTAQLTSLVNFAGGKHNFSDTFGNFVRGNGGGLFSATYTSEVGAVQSIGKLTFTGAPTAGSTFIVGNVTFTAETSGASGNQFNIGSTVTITALNVRNAVNASTNTNSFITATSTAGTVTFTANTAGAIGNGIQLSTTTGNSTATAFTGGTNGTVYVAAF